MKLITALSFMGGAIVGSAITFFGLKNYFQASADAQIAEAEHSFSILFDKYVGKTDKKSPEKKDSKEPPVKDAEPASIMDIPTEYNTHRVNYCHRSEATDDVATVGPTIIPPEEVGEEPTYSIISFTYYIGGDEKVLADDVDDRVDLTLTDRIPEDFSDHFGEYEPDSVYVKSPLYRAYYEILIDNRDYQNVITPFGKISDIEGR